MKGVGIWLCVICCLLLAGCQVRPQVDYYTGLSNVRAADASDESITELDKEVQTLRDARIKAAVALFKQKAATTQPVTPDEIQAWVADSTALEQRVLALVVQSTKLQVQAATSQPVDPVEKASLELQAKLLAAERDALSIRGKALQQRIATFTPITPDDLDRLDAGIQLDRQERSEVAKIVNRGRTANSNVRLLGQRLQVLSQQEAKTVQMFGVDPGIPAQ